MASAKGIYADLHVHTWFSDSSLSPAQAVEEAVRQGVGVLAIADHEGFEGSRQGEELARKAGLDFISGAELECTHEGVQLHVLCYGADRANAALTALAKHSRFVLDKMSEDLIEKMGKDYPHLSLTDFAAFPMDRSRGGWKGLQYLMARGVTSSLKEGMPLYGKYGVGYEQAGFSGLRDVVNAIHGAGGKAVLAHAGYTLRGFSLEEVRQKVEDILSYGLDGLECYYPLHDEAMTDMLLSLCRERDLLITAGSDCHGSFGHSRVGQMNIERSLLRLDGLL